MTQKKALYEYLKLHKSITSLEAFTKLGITRLSGQIYFLKKDGIPIKSELVPVLSRYGKTEVSKYTLLEEEA